MAIEQKKNPQAAGQEPEFAIQRIYIKDVSFETPNSPAIFLEEWKPELNIDLQTKTSIIEDDVHEIILTVTATVKLGEKVAFLAEVHQAGIFTIRNFPKNQLAPMLGSYCPNVLYPYAREEITSLVIKGGFPQLYLTPVNFDALFEQHQQSAGAANEEPDVALEDDKDGSGGDTTKH